MSGDPPSCAAERKRKERCEERRKKGKGKRKKKREGDRQGRDTGISCWVALHVCLHLLPPFLRVLWLQIHDIIYSSRDISALNVGGNVPMGSTKYEQATSQCPIVFSPALQTNAIKGRQYKVSASHGGVVLQKGEGNSAERSANQGKAELTWTPASAGDVTFYAVCIEGYGAQGYLRQESVTVNSVACDSISNPSSSVCNDALKYTGDLVPNAGDLTCQSVPCTKEDDAAKCCKEKEGAAPATCNTVLSDVATFCGDNETFTGALVVDSSSKTCKSSTCLKAEDSGTCCAKRAKCKSINNAREFCSSQTGELNSENSDQYCKGAECKPDDVGICCKASGDTIDVNDDLTVTIQRMRHHGKCRLLQFTNRERGSQSVFTLQSSR